MFVTNGANPLTVSTVDQYIAVVSDTAALQVCVSHTRAVSWFTCEVFAGAVTRGRPEGVRPSSSVMCGMTTPCW